MDLVGFLKRIQRNLSLTHSTLKTAFIFLIWSWLLVKKTRWELVHFIKKKELRVHSAFKWLSQAWICLCLFCVKFHSEQHTVCGKPLLAAESFLHTGVNLFYALYWGENCCDLFLTEESLRLGAKELAVPETLRDLLVVRKMSCCCFYLDHTNSRQSSKKYDFGFAQL